METSTTLENADAQGGNLGEIGDAGLTCCTTSIITYPAPHVKPRQSWPHSVELWPARKAADLLDCVDALQELGQLGLLERWGLARLRRRLLRAVSGRPRPSWSSPEAAGGPPAGAAPDAARETPQQLTATGLVSSDDPATRRAVGAALQATATASCLGTGDRAALLTVSDLEVSHG